MTTSSAAMIARFVSATATAAATAGIVCLVAGLSAAGATTAAEARSLSCEFNAGQTASFEGGAFKSKAPAPLNFLIVDVDLEGQSARVSTGDAGTMGSLKIVRAINANHFIEVLNEGFLTLTTVYDDAGDGRRPAVHTRHMGVLGQPVVTHYTGTCTSR